jgi:four helix bundle protein
MGNNKNQKEKNIYERSFVFAVCVAEISKKIPDSHEAKIYKNQLLRSSASIGANLAEADGSLTKNDFLNKIAIARKEAKESRYWLKLIERIFPIVDKEALKQLIEECYEIILILSKIIINTRSKK